MSLKWIFLSAAFAVFIQLLISVERTSSRQIEKRGGYVEINGSTYFIDTEQHFRDECQAACRALNMTLVTFESPGKYNLISRWLDNNGYGYDYDWFHTGAMRDAGSDQWYWEPTGQNITDFFWGSGQPDYTNNFIRGCITFKYEYNWYDDDCDEYFFNSMCQEV